MARTRRKSASSPSRAGKSSQPAPAQGDLFDEQDTSSEGQAPDTSDGDEDADSPAPSDGDDGYRPIHVKKAPPLPGTTASGVPLVLSELGDEPMPKLVERLRHYGIHAHEGYDRSWLLVLLMRSAEKAGVEVHGEGQLEVLPDGYGFLRSSRNSFLSSPDDLYVARDMIKKHDLRAGMTIMGRVRTERRKEKYFALKDVRRVNGCSPDEAAKWKPFDELTAVFPDRRILLETEDARDFSTRVVDLVAPVGFGQRGLIVSPPRSGKTMMLKSIAHGIAENYPEAKLVVFLVDERPEEVTDMVRSVRGEVIFSTFDELPQRHIQVADRVTERVRSLVETGADVVLLMDSLTRLGRAFNAAARTSGRILSGGLEANALQKPKRLFGAARNIDGGGSLTILATALIETNSRMDEVIFEEFKGTGNMEIVLSRAVSEQRIFPAIDINKSGTRMEDLLLDPAEASLVKKMRVALADVPPVDAMEKLLQKMKKTGSNAEFLLSLNTAVF